MPLNKFKYFIMSNTPIKIMIIPPTFLIVIICFLILPKCFNAREDIAEISKNGIAIPREYTAIKVSPYMPFPDAEIAITEVNTGPIHGVHPKLNPIPRRNAPRYPFLLSVCLSIFKLLCANFIFMNSP